MGTKKSNKKQPVQIEVVTEKDRVDYITRKFKNTLRLFPDSETIKSDFKVGEFAKSLLDMDENTIPPARQFPISLSKVHESWFTQKQLNKVEAKIMKHECSEYDSVTDCPYVCIEFRFRDQLYDKKALLSHSFLDYTLLGGTPDSFESLENDLIYAYFVAGNVGKLKQALLCASLEDEEYYLFELEKFFMVSLIEKDEQGEKGIVTIFNRDLGILYNEYIYGSPTLKDAVLPLTKSNDDTTENDVAPSSSDPANADAIEITSEVNE